MTAHANFKHYELLLKFKDGIEVKFKHKFLLKHLFAVLFTVMPL